MKKIVLIKKYLNKSLVVSKQSFFLIYTPAAENDTVFCVNVHEVYKVSH